MKERIVALLDVDHTFLFDDRLNLELIASLEENIIKDIYLFTDMTFKKSSLEDRDRLIKQLKQRGFVVHGVITPNDLTWNNIRAEEAEQLYAWCFDGTFQGMLLGEAFERFVLSREETLPNLAKVVTTYLPLASVFGQGFWEAMQELNENNSLSQDTICLN